MESLVIKCVATIIGVLVGGLFANWLLDREFRKGRRKKEKELQKFLREDK